MKAKKLILMLGLASLGLAAQLASASTLKMYEQPNTSAKTTGTINLSAGVVRIYSPKGSEWIKIADPTNGNVGWVKAADLHHPNNQHVTFTEHFVHNAPGPMSYNVVQFGPHPAEIDQREMQRHFERMQRRQRAIQLSMQRAMQEMAYEMQSFPWGEFGFPMIMPVVVMPQHGKMAPHPAPKQQVALTAGVQHANQQMAQNQNKEPQKKLS